jgi:inner membrane protein
LMASGAFFVFFFGVGALLVGALSAVGLAPALWTQLLLFTALSVGTLVAFRNALLRRFRLGGRDRVDTLIGETAVALDELPIGATGRVQLRGSPWKAWNAGERPVQSGESCQVMRVDGLTLWVRGA